VRRREFLAGAAGATLMLPLRASAQPLVIGFLGAAAPDEDLAKAVRRGLAEAGYEVGRNIAIEYRYANGKYDQLPSLVTDLKARAVSLIIAMPAPAALAAKKETSTIPIVFLMGYNPVGIGLVESYNKPGGNVTGISMPTSELTAKRIEFLSELLSDHVPIAELVNPANSGAEQELKTSEQVVRSLGREFFAVQAKSKGEIEAAFETVGQNKAALVVWHEGYFTAQRALVVAQAASRGVITIYGDRIYTDAGGLISYGPNILEMCRLVGGYAGKILSGTKPSELPVMQPTKYELVINLKTAKSLGLNIPATLLSRADEVIE
jgi:putative tryptophan/tyrosine transport system substrate-binding protein